MQLSNFLRTVLKLDAASCLAMAVIVLPFAAGLEAPFGIDAAILQGAAASLIPIGLFILWLGTRREVAAGLIVLVIIGNLGWTAASLALSAGLPGMTMLGQLAVTAQAIAVLALALAEWAGLRSSQKASWESA